MSELFGSNMAIVADKVKLAFVDKGIVYVGNLLIFERNLAVELIVSVADILGELFLVISLFQAFKAEVSVGAGAVKLHLVAVNTEHFGAVYEPELGGGVVRVELVLAVFLQIAILFEERNLAVRRKVIEVIHQSQNIGSSPGQYYAILREFYKLIRRLHKAYAFFKKLLVGNVSERGNMARELLADFRLYKQRERILVL